MSNRKPLDENCDGGIDCPVEGHVLSLRSGGRVRVWHVPLTVGQRQTLLERRAVRRG